MLMITCIRKLCGYSKSVCSKCVKNVRSSENCMKTVRMWMIHFNETKTFSEAFGNTNLHFKYNQLWVWVWFMYY